MRRKRCEKCAAPKTVTRASASSRARRARARTSHATEHLLLPATTSSLSPSTRTTATPSTTSAIRYHLSAGSSVQYAQPPQAAAAATPTRQQLSDSERRQELEAAIDSALDEEGYRGSHDGF